MPILNSLLSWFTEKRLNQINWYETNPQDIQTEVLFKLIEQAQSTVWGEKYDYKSLESIRNFQERVPLSHYEDLKPYIQRIIDGEQNVLWNTPIKWFAKSSGTTSDKSKFIPISKESLEDCHYRGGRDVILLYNHNYPDSNLLKGKSLALGGSRQISKFSMDSYFGDLSAILMQNMPFWSQLIRTPELSVALMDEWEEKIQKIAEITSDQNVVSLAGVPSWTLVLIKEVLKKQGKSSILDVWPNLELFIHGGVSFTPYREQFKQLIQKDDMHYMETYNASEGFFAIQDKPNRNDMLLMLDVGIFYEFIPVEEIHKENPKAYLVEEVELGKNYAIVISTNAGLWRYIIGDTVEFTCKCPHRIKVTGRIKHFINTFGEEVIIDNAERALSKACQSTNANIREYTAGPVYIQDDTKGAHEWIIEFEKEPRNIQEFMEILDLELQAVNSDYEAKRYKNMVLDFPKINVVKDGTFYAWLKEKGKLGGQHKVPRLANNREYLDQILSFVS